MNEQSVDVKMYVHPLFKELCFDIQDERIKSGTDKARKKMSLPRITKMIVNMIEANAKIKQALMEVKQDGKK